MGGLSAKAHVAVSVHLAFAKHLTRRAPRSPTFTGSRASSFHTSSIFYITLVISLYPPGRVEGPASTSPRVSLTAPLLASLRQLRGSPTPQILYHGSSTSNPIPFLVLCRILLSASLLR